MTEEAPGVVSILLRGRQLDRLPVAGGQFFQWRFLRRGLWWQAHPYSLSAAPTGDELRITVKDLGDHSAGLARQLPGTRVAIEGPYGTFTADTATQDRLLLIGAGVGTAPILSLLHELPRHDRRDRPAACLDAATTSCSPTRSPTRSRAAAGASSSSSARAHAGAPRRPGPARARARRPRPRGLPLRPRRAVRAARRPSWRAPTCPSTASASSPSPSDGDRTMRRSPIVIGATIAGTAGVLAFHPHASAVQTATATAKTDDDRRRHDPPDERELRRARRRRSRPRRGHRHRRRDRHAVRQRPGPGHRHERQDRQDRGAAAAGQRPALAGDLLVGRADPAAGGRSASRPPTSTPSAARPSRARATRSRCSPRWTSSGSRPRRAPRSRSRPAAATSRRRYGA